MDKKQEQLDCRQKSLEFFIENNQLKILSNFHPIWECDSILALMDTVLDKNQELYNIVKKDYYKIIPNLEKTALLFNVIFVIRSTII